LTTLGPEVGRGANEANTLEELNLSKKDGEIHTKKIVLEGEGENPQSPRTV